MSQLGDLLTSRQAAERAGINPRTLRRWVAAGRLTPAVQLPGKTGDQLFTPADIDRAAGRDEWLAS